MNTIFFSLENWTQGVRSQGDELLASGHAIEVMRAKREGKREERWVTGRREDNNV